MNTKKPIHLHNKPTDETIKQDDNGDLANVMLPCPFCGGGAEVLASWLNSCKPKKYHWFYPTCKGEIRKNCPAIVEEQDEQGGCCCDCKTVKEAVELWNKRIQRYNLFKLLELIVPYAMI